MYVLGAEKLCLENLCFKVGRWVTVKVFGECVNLGLNHYTFGVTVNMVHWLFFVCLIGGKLFGRRVFELFGAVLLLV